MADRFRFFIDNGGLSRSIETIWANTLDIDVIWMTGTAPDEEISLQTEKTPILELSTADIAALSTEIDQSGGQVLVLFDGLQPCRDAASFGLEPQEITIVRHTRPDGERLAPNVYVTTQDLDDAHWLIARGFRFEIQSLPNVTPRPWQP